MKKGFKNILTSVGGQLIIMALGIVVPRFVLQSYGDEANGLINAVGQLFTYLALIEAGVGQAALQALYEPVAAKDHVKINSILSATKKMFAKLTKIYCIIVVLFAVIYPLCTQINDRDAISLFGSSYLAVFLIIIFQGLSNAIGFYYVSTLKQLLMADGCNYIIVNITTVIRAATSILRILLINLKINIVCLQLVYIVLACAEMALYKTIIKKRYGHLNLHSEPDHSALGQRNAFVFHEISNVVFNSTDVLILSLFCDFTIASIYAVYNLVFSALNAIINQVHSGCMYILGQTYGNDRRNYERIHDMYDSCFIAFIFALISTSYLTITPFITIYTKGITEVNYIIPVLPLLFCLIQLLSGCRTTCSNLIKIAGHAKYTVNRAVIEAAVNLIVSILLVKFIGITGVLLGTIAALLYRANDMIIYANLRILKRKPLKTYMIIFLNFSLFFVLVFLRNRFGFFNIDNYGSFFVIAILTCICMFILFFVINVLFNNDLFKLVCHGIKRKKSI